MILVNITKLSLWPKSSIRGLYPTLMASLVLVLPGCTGSTYSSHFDCPMGDVGGCASISKVNKMLDRNEINLGDDDTLKKDKTCQEQKLSGDNHSVYVYYGPDQLGRLIYPGQEERNR